MVYWILQSLVDRIYFSSPCCFASYFFRLYRVPANAARMLTRSVLTGSSDGSVSTDKRCIDATLEREAPGFVHQGLRGGFIPLPRIYKKPCRGCHKLQKRAARSCFSVVRGAVLVRARGVVSVLVLNRGWCCVPWRCCCVEKGHYIP